MPGAARKVGATMGLKDLKQRAEDETPEAEERRVKQKLEIHRSIQENAFLLDFQQETGLLGIFETRIEKEMREQLEDRFLVTPIFLENRNPLTEATSVEELTTGEISVFRQVYQTLEKVGGGADGEGSGIDGSIDAQALRRALLCVKLQVTEEQAQHMIDTADTDGNGTVRGSSLGGSLCRPRD